MTSSGLEWDYYEFQPVETSSLEYATPGENSLLLPANPVNSHWSSNAISDWSMSNHTAPTSEIAQDPVAMIKAMKEEKNKKKQRRKARKNPRRSEREHEVSNLLCTPALFRASLQHVCLCRLGGIPPEEEGRVPPLHDSCFFHELSFAICLHCALSFSPCRREN